MKQEEMFKILIKELFGMDELHQEYQDEDTHIVVDSQKDGNTLTIKVELLENNKDKKEFERWIKNLDDDIFIKAYEELQKQYDTSLDDLYNSNSSYKELISNFKNSVKDIVESKIESITSEMESNRNKILKLKSITY